MKVESALGEVVDKVTILRLKESQITDPSQIANVRAEREALCLAWSSQEFPIMENLVQYPKLCAVNRRLWEVEDALRRHEAKQVFDDSFVDLARSVYKLNDQRAVLKREISIGLGSVMVEEKLYPDYMRA